MIEHLTDTLNNILCFFLYFNISTVFYSIDSSHNVKVRRSDLSVGIADSHLTVWWLTGWSCSIDTVHSKYCNTELHTSRKCHCSVGVTSGDVGVDTVIRGVDDSDHILHCTVTHTPANQ